MRILKALALVAVAGALASGAAQAQTATGSAWLTGVNGSYWNYVSPAIGEWTSPYFMRFKIPTLPTNASLLPPAGTSTWGPTVDIFCVDLYNNLGVGDQYAGCLQGGLAVAHELFLAAADRRVGEILHLRALENMQINRDRERGKIIRGRRLRRR